MDLGSQQNHSVNILNALKVAVVAVSPDGKIQSFNLAWQRIVERTGANYLPGSDFLQLCRDVWQVPSLDRLKTALYQITSGETQDVTLTLPCTLNSRRHWIEARATALQIQTETLAIVSHKDITEQVVSQALANGYTRWLASVHHGDSMDQLFKSLIKLVEEVVEGDHCAVLLAGGEHAPYAVPDRGEGILSPRIWGTRILPLPTDHPLVLALQAGRMYWTADIRSEPTWEGHRDALVARGVSAVWMVPIHGDGGQLLGGCVMFSDSTSPYDLVSCRMMAFMENLVRLTIERRTMENARRKFEERLYDLAYHDHLTGLPNRAQFMGALEEAWVNPQESPSQLAVLYLDLDNFKDINDTLGHQTGDRLLLAVAAQVAAQLAAGELLARLGGDEFAILLHGPMSKKRAEEVACHIAKVLESPMELDGGEHFVTFSIGIAAADGLCRAPEDLLRHADVAMYQAKRSHNVAFVHFDDHLHADATTKLQLKADLRKALRHSEWWLAYQPVVDVRTGELQAVEALARWQHPTLGNIRPDTFILVAEETGLIVPLGLEILREACRQAVQWQRVYPSLARMKVSVNLSPRQITRELVADVKAVLCETGLPADLLQLEITETRALQEASSLPVLGALREIGVHLALDDFGTGYSALAALKTLPIDVLKIDRSFVMNMLTTQVDAAIVAAAVQFGKVLEVGVVAEGVEEQAHVAVLRGLGCDLIQGFGVAKPLAPKDFEALISGSEQAVEKIQRWGVSVTEM